MNSDLSILKKIWERVRNCDDIPFSENASLNEENLSMVLLDSLIIIYVKDGEVILSYSAEMYHPIHIINVYNFLYNFLGSILTVGDCFYIEFKEDGTYENLYVGDDAQRFALKDRCFHVFKDLLTSRNMLDYLSSLDPNEMYKC